MCRSIATLFLLCPSSVVSLGSRFLLLPVLGLAVSLRSSWAPFLVVVSACVLFTNLPSVFLGAQESVTLDPSAAGPRDISGLPRISQPAEGG